MENKKNDIRVNNELNDDQLDQVAGGAINVYDAPVKHEYWKYTCRACGNTGVVLGWPSACFKCNDANIVREEYKP